MSAARWQRTAGIAFGIGTHVLFAVLVWRLVAFLAGGHLSAPAGSGWGNAMLAAQFGVLHSLLLHPRCRKVLSAWVLPPFYGCFFTVCTAASLFLMFGLWRSQPGMVWQLTATARVVMWSAFVCAWIALLYSLSLTGLGYQTGWTTWWRWYRALPAKRREFKPTSFYRVIRHPVYLSFLGLVWLTPDMSTDRAVLTVVWTPYVLIGSYLKDERLAHFLGSRYRAYQARVIGYPLMFWGPLARRSPHRQSARKQPAKYPMDTDQRVRLRKAA